MQQRISSQDGILISITTKKCITFNKRGDKGKHVFKINGNPLENIKSYKYLRIYISGKNCSLEWTLRDLSVKANRALFGLKTNLNLMKMPIKLLLKIYDTMVAHILLYGAEVWAESCIFTPDQWDKTEIENALLLSLTLRLPWTPPIFTKYFYCDTVNLNFHSEFARVMNGCLH